jgi:hypothetical protein
MEYKDDFAWKGGKPLKQFMDECIALIHKQPLIVSWCMNRTVFFVLHWTDILRKTCEGTGFELDWDYPLGPTADQYYTLHFYPEDWPI